MTDVHLKRKVTLREKQPIGSDSPKPSKVPKIVLGIVVVALLGVCGYFLLNRTEDTPNEEKPTVQVEGQADSTSTSTDTTKVAAQNDEQASTSSQGGDGSQNAEAATLEKESTVPASSVKSEQSPAQESTVVAVGNVEEKVRQVIRGNYGNGQVRKDKLGAEYRTIQDKVNEMYRKGLVR